MWSFHLTAEDQLQGDQSHAQTDKTVVDDANSNFKDYKYVLPSARAIADHKQMLASEMESEAAAMLFRKYPNTKATVHLDITTSQSIIYGEWPSIILRKDRDQITKLFSETFQLLAAAISIREGMTIEPAMLWE